ncbi:MAG: peptidase E [Oscillospiraceae bacterium]
MGKIVAIGGGEIKKGELLEIDKYIVSMTGKENPRFLFIPTASRDAGGYINAVKREFKTKLGCSFSTLLFYLSDPDDDTVREKISGADIIYVGGGNTAMMMAKWREHGVDILLKKAYERGAVMCGISAGAICWFKSGYSDSEAFYGDGGSLSFCEVDGLGLIDAVSCPHYNEPERKSFDAFVSDKHSCGIAIDSCAALIVEDSICKVLGTVPDSAVHILDASEGTLKKRTNTLILYLPAVGLRLLKA